MASCNPGLELQNRTRSQQAPTQINFLFSDSVAETSPSTQTSHLPARLSQTPSGDGTADPDQPRDQTSTPAPNTSIINAPAVDTRAISTDTTAADLAIPLSDVDPNLQVFDQNSDPSNHVSSELIAESDLVSFYITAGRRDSESSEDIRRPVQLVERLFLHATEAGASIMYDRILDQAVPSYANAALDIFRQTYPDITPSSRMTDQFSVATQNHLVELRIDSETSRTQRSLKDDDPHIYYLVLREGRVAALFEFLYLSAQDPASVTAIADQFVTRVTRELGARVASAND